MYGRLNEDVAWTRLQDMQREMENHSRFDEGRDEAVRVGMMRSLGGLLRQAAGSVLQRVPRPAGRQTGSRPATPSVSPDPCPLC